MVERFNSTLLNIISVFIRDNQSDWDKNLPLLTAAYRSAKHESTTFSPNLLFLGRETNLPIDLTLGVSNPGQQSECDYVADLQESMMTIYDTVRANFRKYSHRQKRNYDVRLSTNSYKQGDLVYLLHSTKTIGQCPKLKPKDMGGTMPSN